jgi:hypothetical protein
MRLADGSRWRVRLGCVAATSQEECTFGLSVVTAAEHSRGSPRDLHCVGHVARWGAIEAQNRADDVRCEGRHENHDSRPVVVLFDLSRLTFGGRRTSSGARILRSGVAEGVHVRTYTNDGTGPTGEAHPATVSTFRLDEYLVAVGRFRQFANAVLPPDGGVGWLPSPGSGKHTYLNGGNGLNAIGGGYEPGWVASDDNNIAPTNANLASFPSCTWTNTAGGEEFLPINCVNWYEAYAFCIWDGGFLPSEAEWEYAAAAGNQQREYPWGSTDPVTANQYAIFGCYYPSGSRSCTGVANLAPVGTAAAGVGFWG